MRSRFVVLPVLLTLQASLLQLERHARAAAAHGNDDGNDAMVDDGLHAHLAKLEEQHGGVPAGDGAPLARTRSERALAEAAAERARRRAALAVTEAEREQHAALDAETRLLQQAITVFHAGATLAHSLEEAGFMLRFEQVRLLDSIYFDSI
eukprot:COSAG04_NODE_4799_length_1889_cov_1.259218_3_plen_151_part_00